MSQNPATSRLTFLITAATTQAVEEILPDEHAQNTSKGNY